MRHIAHAVGAIGHEESRDAQTRNCAGAVTALAPREQGDLLGECHFSGELIRTFVRRPFGVLRLDHLRPGIRAGLGVDESCSEANEQ